MLFKMPTIISILSRIGCSESECDAVTRQGSDLVSLRHEIGVEALEIAARTAGSVDRLRHARALTDIRDGLLLRVPARARIEADAEAVLTAMGQVTRPGPKVRLAPDILDAIIEALRGPFRLRVRYNRDAVPRILEPHGVLLVTGPISPRAIQKRRSRCATSA